MARYVRGPHVSGAIRDALFLVGRPFPSARASRPRHRSRRGSGAGDSGASRPRHAAAAARRGSGMDRHDHQRVRRFLPIRQRRLARPRYHSGGLRLVGRRARHGRPQRAGGAFRARRRGGAALVAASGEHPAQAGHVLRDVHGFHRHRGGRRNAHRPAAGGDRLGHVGGGRRRPDRFPANPWDRRRLPLLPGRGSARRRPLCHVAVPGRPRLAGPRLLHEHRPRGGLAAAGVRRARGPAAYPRGRA